MPPAPDHFPVPNGQPGMLCCRHCNQVFHASALPPHENVCARWVCAGMITRSGERCGARFAMFPDPLAKRYGSAPLCSACMEVRGPQPDYLRAQKVAPEGGAHGPG